MDQGNRYATATAAVAVLAACNSPRAANNSNFQAAIQTYHDSQKPCMVPWGVYPNANSLSPYCAEFLTEMGLFDRPSTSDQA